MKNNFKLSFCIPTYNNAKSVYRLVSDILSFDKPDIEVVVLDNGSSDDTLLILKPIIDNRLSVYSNDVNKGALFNMMNVLDKGTGDYLVYCTDHDHININKIEDFLAFFQTNPGLSFGYCEYKQDIFKRHTIYNKGYDSLKNMAYKTRHPTGFFFKKEYWKAIESVKRFSDYNFVDLFPLEFVFSELSLCGKGAIYKDNIFSPETGDRVVKHKSATTKGYSKTAFFAPECRLKLALSFRKHIQSLAISEVQKNELILDTFYRELKFAVFNYKQVLGNEKLCIHYHMEKRNVGQFEQIAIVLRFFSNYCKKVKEEQNNFKFFFLVIFRLKSFLGLIYRIALK